MLEAYEITHLHEGDETLQVIASFEERQKSRYRTETLDGKALAWIVERGYVLKDGDVLKCNDGTLVAVQCATEDVSDVSSSDAHTLLRVAYHLGNRHVPLQVEPSLLRYQRDHVLDDMVRGLGLTVEHVEAPFQPESGAYSGGGHHHHD
jgi:urease accessory protein